MHHLIKSMRKGWFIVYRSVGRASAACGRFGSDHSYHSDASAACGRWRNGSETWKSHYNMTLDCNEL